MCLSGLMGRERIHNLVGGWASARRDRDGGMVDKGDRRKTWVWRRRTGGINRSFESIRQILFLRLLSMLSLTRKYCAVSFRARAETILLHATPRRVPGYLLNDVPAQERATSVDTWFSTGGTIQWIVEEFKDFFFYVEYCFGKWYLYWNLVDGVFMFLYISTRKSEKFVLYKSTDIFPDSRET